MIEGIQKALLVGVGATVVTLDAVESGLKYLVQRGRLTAEEARQAANRVMEEGRKEASEAGTTLNTRLNRALSKAHLVTLDQYRALEERVALLEQKVFAQAAPEKID